MLSVYRGLDLTDEQGFLGGKILADLGADVIKVERPGGDKARSIGPFYGDISHPERSLFWCAYNANKRGITLNIESRDGQEIFARLVRTADFVIESFAPGYLEKLELGYQALSQTALGGVANEYGDPDRAPLRIALLPQSYFHAGAQAALAICLALYHRTATGEGQHIDVSIHESITVAQMPSGSQRWDAMRQKTRRCGTYIPRIDAAVVIRQIYRCKDGWICWTVHNGLMGHHTRRLVEWMESEGQAGDLADIDWYSFDFAKETQESVNLLENRFEEFFKQFAKAELYEQAIEKSIPIYPVSNAADLLANTQLKSRGYWVEVEHPELRAAITYPGAFIKASATPLRLPRRAPLIGEHNQEIFCKELGLSQESLICMTQAGAI
jgi:crotonobetainyl-CoA:carnitine CoA-transferase CaiB-like acyl-CoA transferase